MAYQDEILQVFPHLGEKLEFRKTSFHANAPMDTGSERIAIAIATFLGSLGSKDCPVTLWIDDCQWLDEQILRVFRLLDDLPKSHLKIVLSMRPPNDRNLCASQQIGHCKRISLKPFKRKRNPISHLIDGREAA